MSKNVAIARAAEETLTSMLGYVREHPDEPMRTPFTEGLDLVGLVERAAQSDPDASIALNVDGIRADMQGIRRSVQELARQVLPATPPEPTSIGGQSIILVVDNTDVPRGSEFSLVAVVSSASGLPVSGEIVGWSITEGYFQDTGESFTSTVTGLDGSTAVDHVRAPAIPGIVQARATTPTGASATVTIHVS